MAFVDSGTLLGGKYRLERLIGRGGMGSVWRAQHLGLGAPVAVKLLDLPGTNSSGVRAKLPQSAIRRFQSEAQAAASIRCDASRPHFQAWEIRVRRQSLEVWDGDGTMLEFPVLENGQEHIGLKGRTLSRFGDQYLLAVGGMRWHFFKPMTGVTYWTELSTATTMLFG